MLAQLEPQDVLAIFELLPLDENDIRLFAQHRSVEDVDRLIRDLERLDLFRRSVGSSSRSASSSPGESSRISPEFQSGGSEFNVVFANSSTSAL